jgi:phosphate starvation-inducible PhoH-like protein
MESVVTRIGENCQIILCGDPAQSDIRGKNGLDYIAQIIEDYDVEDAEVINFYPEDNVRSGITKRFVQIFDRIRGDKK